MVVVMAVVDGRGLKSPAFGVDGDGRTIGLLVLLFLMLLCTPESRNWKRHQSARVVGTPAQKETCDLRVALHPGPNPPVSSGVPRS